ncbi:hypothetical protein Pla22_17890 [Rubripirellula amarantea]|uniref:DUF1549 domain-containing protein n=1 Tax=Rubripirellula amarantea TaxID=2527999 RepID=A0A5C5WT98_9BACT|nr:hypothetical protein [Rubripirellula amarantea]TWT54154.1 hypothetical protein Pla22_17890 [Rubripirellula amarantea]
MNQRDDETTEPSGKELSPAELVAMDAWLEEILAQEAPPELTSRILDQYHKESIVTVKRSPRPTASRASKNAGADHRRWWIGLIAVAASLVLMVAAWQFRNPGAAKNATNSTGDGNALIVGKPKKKIDSAIVSKSINDPVMPTESLEPKSVDAADPTTPKRKPQGVVLKLPDDAELWNMSDRSANGQLADRDRGATGPLLDVALVSKRIENHLHEFWNASDTQPTPSSTLAESASRLSIQLGVDVPVEVLESPSAVQAWMKDDDIARAIANEWLYEISARRFKQLSDQSKEVLVNAIGKCISSSDPIDELIADWLSGRGIGSNEFITALGPEESSPKDPVRIANLASLTLSVDLQCARCHDALVDTKPSQQEYWNFAALVSASVSRYQDGLLRVNEIKPNGSEALFFELPDRRQRAAVPRVANQWLNRSDVRSLHDLADALRGSQPLASGIVNSLWKLVHGRPLRGHVGHPMSAPMTEELAKLEQELIDDLIRSNFDFRRTLAMIMTSATTRRSVPDSVRDVWAADTSDAHRKAIAFAGALPSEKPLYLADRLDQSLRAIGAKLESSDRELLAQLGDNSESLGSGGAVNTLAWDFPDRADGPPVQWLASLDDLNSKVEHLCYLAGHTQVPAVVDRCVSAMQDAKLNDATLLHRVWWMLQ